MKCPKCQSAMERVMVDEIEVDRCTSCKGLWFDMLEDEKLKSRAAEVDIGKSRMGAKHKPAINCPVCPNTQLIRMVDPHQPHVWFESCPSCFGSFFDAGEFRDLGKQTLGDVIKRIFTRERK